MKKGSYAPNDMYMVGNQSVGLDPSTHFNN